MRITLALIVAVACLHAPLHAADKPAGDKPAKKQPAPKKKAGITGVVKAVNFQEDTVTLEGGKDKDGKPLPDQTYKATGDVKVRQDGAFMSLRDVPMGSEVSLTLNAEKMITSITVESTKKTK